MCGVVGFVGEPKPQVLASMRDALIHRGPDEAGDFQDARVSLAHRRLSIVDLAHGRQPFADADQSIVLVFNGEIYNHPHLKRELEDSGARYRTHCDTETILRAYERFGPDCLERLDGMFAFVLYDRRKKLLFGARDRMGKKPLYYFLNDGRSSGVEFAFASEPKALRRHPAIAAAWRVSPVATARYLLFDYVPGVERIYQGLRLLPPGCTFTYGLPDSERPGLVVRRYWDCPPLAETPGFDPVEPDPKRLIDLLRDAVERRLMADVPLGVFLSGGIDSSAIVAMLCQLRRPQDVDCFTIGFDDPSFDESGYAELAAAHFGVRWHVRRFTLAEMLDRLPGVLAMLDEPFADPSILPTSMLSQFTRERATVALGGDGGDELFCGYDPFRAVQPAQWADCAGGGRFWAKAIHAVARLAPASGANLPLGFKLERFARGLSEPPSLRMATWMGAFSLPTLRRVAPGLASVLATEIVFEPVLKAYDQLASRGVHATAQATEFFQRFYLPDDILAKVDRASMMHSLEVRTPFLDRALVEYVQRLPWSSKIRCGRTKLLLREALEGIVPKEILLRRKKGFGIPVSRWIRGELAKEVESSLLGRWPSELDVFDRPSLKQLLDEHIAGGANRYKELWALYMLRKWGENHLG